MFEARRYKMSQVKTIDLGVEREFELVTYKDLTQGELRSSNYPNFKFGGIFMDGVNENTGYKYEVGFVIDHPHGPYLKIDTEKRKDFLGKGSEKNAEDAFKRVAFAMRSKTGGYFEIHPFYGAIWGTHFNPITDFCKGGEDDDLTTIIHFTDNGNTFDDALTREATSMGTTIAFPGPNAQRCLDYQKKVNRKNPNQGSRDQAIVNGLGELWDAEFERYNPHAKRKWLITKIFNGRKQSDIPPAIGVTQNRVADFMDYLQNELGFTGLRVTQTNYKGLTLVEFDASTLPKDKVSGMFDQHYNRIE